MFNKSLVVLSATLVLAGSSAAFAMNNKSDQRTGARAELSTAQQSRQVAKSSDVVVNGRVIGRDPDANVRLQMKTDYLNFFR